MDIKITAITEHGEMELTDSKVVNIDSYIPAGEYNPHNVRPWALHDQFGLIAIAFAYSAQDALDEIVDAGKLDSYMVKPEEIEEDREEEYAYLGNAPEPFDLGDYVRLITLKNPPLSFCTLYEAFCNGKEAIP